MSGSESLRRGGDAAAGGKLALVGLTAFAFFVVLLPASAQDDEVSLEQPDNIICRNNENADVDDSIQVRWDSASENESGHEVHRSVDGGDFAEVGTVSADIDDNERFVDTDVGPDSEYRYKVRAVADGDTGPFSDVCRRPQQLDSQNGNFRVYHRPYPAADAPPRKGVQMRVPDDTTSDGDNEYAARIAGLLEDSRSSLESLGFADLVHYEGDPDGPVAVDLKALDPGTLGSAWTNAVGSTDGKLHLALSPPYLDPYDPSTGANAESVATTLHEAFHLQQYHYGGVFDDPASDWVLEGQAASVEDKVCVGDNSSSCHTVDDHSGYTAGYPGRVKRFLATPDRDLTRRRYHALLFWTYLLEQHGDLDQEPERGMDLMVEFWERAEAQRRDTGIGTINRMLDEIGESDRFADVFEDFVVANYTKDLDGVPDTHRYRDQAQTPVQYREVARDTNRVLNAGEQIGPNLDDVSSWGARYYQIRPDEAVGALKVEAHQDASNKPAFYAVLGVEDDQLTLERRGSGADFVESFDNPGYDRVVLIVAGLRQDLNFRWAVNAEEPVMDIVEPSTGQRAQAGDPGDPDKFLTKVDVLDPDGDPVAGLDPESFTVTVGAETVSDDEMVSRSFVQGQYWLLLHAPEQSGGAGRYDLTVEVAGLSDTEVDAVEYGPRSEVDNELIVDYSGSMGEHDKMSSTRQAAHLYVDTWPSSDLAGLVSFNDTAQVEEDLASLTDAHRESLHGSIANLDQPDGQTAIGEGLFTGLDQLDNRGNEDHDWAVVLLSDGLQTSGNRDIDDFVDEYDSRTDDGDPTPEVHTVALGPDADRGALQSLASETGGTYQFASLPDDATTSGTATTAAAGESDDLTLRLPAIWRVISEEIVGEQQVFAGHGNTNTSPSNSFQVDGGAEELTVAASSEGLQSYDATLTDPSGTTHEPEISRFDRTFWRVDGPQAGEWTIRVDMLDTQESFPQTYQVDAAVTSHLTMEGYLGLAPEDRLAGRGMPILVSLSDTGPVTGANVDVAVTAPDGSSSTLTLFDDGAHGDGEAGDGFYGATYRATHEPGSYVATISAEGSSGVFGDFARRARTSFATTAGDDTDGDGLPDWWEEEHSGDPTGLDPDADPDGDVLTTGEEWEIGSLPLDPDSDGGGELDGTDPDPLDPGDDRLSAPDAEAYPGVGEVLVRYSHSDAYTSLRVERAPDRDGPFTAIADGVSATGEYTDETVTNGDEFCYRVRGLGGGAESAYSPVTCATPRTDPVPPDGAVLIEGGAPTTADPDVTLELPAGDNPEPHFVHPGAAPRPDEAEESGVADMRLSNDPALSDADWEPYAETREWTLPDELGPATVYAQYRDAAGNTSDVVNASIELVDEPTDGDGGDGGGDGDGDGDAVQRSGGPTRVETAREISRTTRDQAEAVVIARADEYADALAGAPLATHLDGPVLLTGGGSLHSVTADEIQRLGADRAVLLGGEAALSQQVADDVAGLGVDVRRLGGSDRFDTARLIAGELPEADEVYVAEGVHTDPARGWPDAMSAAGAAAAQRAPVLLVAHDLVPEATTDALGSDQDVAVVGGTAAVSADVADTLDAAAGTVRRLSGSTRYGTSAQVADDAVDAGADPATTWVATGRDWADALVSAAATGQANGTLVMVDGQNLEFSPATRDWIRDHADVIESLNLAGGTAAISTDTADALSALLSP